MSNFKSIFVETNGIRMHALEQGTGPLVVFCHGFPELGYSWRHQIEACARAGFRVVAPDQRGYGQTDRPAEDKYTLCHLAADIVGLVQALGEEKAAIVGHDWGSPVAWTCALLRPDIFKALGLLSVPYLANFWSGPPPTSLMKHMLAGGTMFYQYYFQEPGKADLELGHDARESLLRLFYSASGSAPPEHRWRYRFSPDEKLYDTIARPETLPDWLAEEDLAHFAAEFSRTGFTGGLNWYRNMDRDKELLGFLAGSKIQQPSLFVAGAEDVVIEMYRAAYDSLEQSMPNLKTKILIPGAGHWVQQETPEQVNRPLLEFLASTM